MNNWQSSKTCVTCVWCGQCGAEEICDYYSPFDDGMSMIEITYYEDDLRLRAAEYREVISEYADDTPLSDWW